MTSSRRKESRFNPVYLVAYALILLPVVLGFLFVRLFGVDIPFGDVWTMVPQFDKLSVGALGFMDLWVLHWEHRVFFPRIVLLLVGVFADFDQVVVMYLIQVLLLATLVVILLAFKDDVGWKPFLFVPIPFLLFNLGQYFNLFNGLQIAFSLTLVFSVFAFYLLHVAVRRGFKVWAFAGAMVGGVVASFSLLSGLFVWPVGFLQLFVSPLGRRAKVILMASWSLAGLVVWAAYFYGWSIPERQAGSYFFDNPGLVPGFFLTALGDPLAWWAGTALSLVCGVLLLLFAAVSLFFVYRTGRVGEYSFWLALLAFSTLYLIFLTLGRAGGGVEAAMNSRYITFTILAIIGIYGMLAKLSLERGSGVVTGSLVLLFALVLVGAPFSYVEGIEQGQKLERVRTSEAVLLATYRSQSEEALNIANRRSEYVRKNAFVLCKLGYTVFSEPEAQAGNCLPPSFSSLSPAGAGTALYQVDKVAGVNPSKRGAPITVSASRDSLKVGGWAIDAANKELAGGVYIKIDDKRFPAFYGKQRKRVPRGLDVPLYQFPWFEATVPMSEIGPGKHELSVVVVTSDGEKYYRPSQGIAFKVVEKRKNNKRASS